MMVLCIGLTAVIGISTAYIMKRLDNMVKLYAESLSSMLMTVACVVLFPKRFTIDTVFIVSLLLTLFAIFLYEKDNLKLCSVQNGCKKTWKTLCHQKARMILLVVVAVLGFISVCVVAVNLTIIWQYVADMKIGGGTAEQPTIPPNHALPHVRFHKVRKMPALKQ